MARTSLLLPWWIGIRAHPPPYTRPPSLGSSHALCHRHPPHRPSPAQLLLPPSGNAVSGFPSDLQVLVNKVLQQCRLVRSRLPNPHQAKFRPRLNHGSGRRPRRVPRPSSSALASALQDHRAAESFLRMGVSPISGPGFPTIGWSWKTSLRELMPLCMGTPDLALVATRRWPRLFSLPSSAPNHGHAFYHVD